MSDNTANTKSILKNDPSFDGLDFNALRAEGINYVAELSGKIWSDHNVHDPGITILELLSYALMDLGYRTRMPAIDIFSRNPNDTSTEDDNFFTPAQILTCNPVTIMDFRKLLIDIKEVKNAWLEINEDWIDCQDQDGEGNPGTPPIFLAAAMQPGAAASNCKTFLNGLYKVYLELYKGPNTPEVSWTNKEREYIEDVVEKVRNTLMAHRNLCEDFVSITVLCKEKIGVCADIELEPTADAEKVYVKIIETLKAFFSPDPKFYTLPQLMEKGKPIEEIFAGRPYLPESYGFVDTAELESIPFRKEIHVSDVYSALFSIEGIRTVRKLRLRKCDSTNENTTPDECDWKYYLPEKHTAEFSLACSGFRFTRNEMPVSVNEKKYKAFFDLNYSFSGKILHKEQFNALDLPVPKGIYRPDLAGFYSIQNELPHVYGVKEGGIPETASPLRQAQALQLKGYLLFFDQLLANYLSQLSQLRKLFAFKNMKLESSTYFTGIPQFVPDIEKLLRFSIADGQGSIMGEQGAIYAIPVNKSDIDFLVSQNKLKDADITNDFDKLEFVTAADRDVAMYSLIDDLQNKNYSVYTDMNSAGNWFFYIYTTSDEVALISQKYYIGEKEAKIAATNFLYIGTFKENYRSYTQNNSSASYFYIELNMAGYSTYLQQISENKQLYLERRRVFLDHLLARFAESFTDFALLSFSTLQEEELKQKELIKKGKFLSNYDTLSRDRGKAYNYYTNGWNNNNISGFEKRVESFTGMHECCGQTLSHFEVMEYTGQYFWTIAAGGKNIFKSNSLFDSTDEAVTDLEDFLKALKSEDAYKPTEIPLYDAHALSIQYKEDKVSYPVFQPSETKAAMVGEQLRKIATATPGHDDIFVSKEVFRLQLFNDFGISILKTGNSFDTHKHALSAAKQLLKRINDEDWEVATEGTSRPKFDLKAGKADPFRLIDITSFVKHVVTCPDEYRWQLDNTAGNLVLTSTHTYASRQEGLESLLNELTSYGVNIHSFRLHDQDNNYRFDLIGFDGSVLGTSPVFATEATRVQAIDFILEFCRNELEDAQYTYHIAKACHWQVTFAPDLVFRSVALLADPENAINSWRKDKRSFRVQEDYIWERDVNRQRLLIKDDRDKIIAWLISSFPTQNTQQEVFNYIQESLTNRTFKVEAVKVEAGYGFKLHNQEQVLLSGYEVYTSRGAAFYNMLRALEKAGHESMYLKSGDEGNHEFTFLLKNDESQFLAEHPLVYDSEKERDDALNSAINFLKTMHAPANVAKEPIKFTFHINSGERLLLQSTLKLLTIKEAGENANLVLIQAGDVTNFRSVYNRDTKMYHSVLTDGNQWIATVPGSFADETAAEDARSNVMVIVRPHLYSVRVTPFPDQWRFNYHLGIEPWRVHFVSTEEYSSEELASQAYKKMATDTAGLKLQKNEGLFQLVSKHKLNKSNISANILQQQEHQDETVAETALAMTQLLSQLATTEDKRVLQRMIKQDPMAAQGTWVYRIRRKEEYFAYHLDCTNSQNTDQLIKGLYDAVNHKPDYLLICLGGDITWKRKDASGEYYYHYVIKARNVYYPAPNDHKELLLFISTKGYATQEDAEKAFVENYLLILKRASKQVNYGIGKFISLEEIFSKPGDACATAETAVVYVPKETIEDYFGNNTANTVAELTELSKSYPIRLSGKDRYKFSLYDYKVMKSYFISAEYYNSSMEAMKAFMFLLVLMKNKKNYYVYCDPDTGNTFIVLREILLESNRRFLTEDEAWGRDGIEKLVAVSQTEYAFHIYINPDDCCFSFFVACKGKLIHPCVYDTDTARDEAMWNLYREVSNYQIPELPVVTHFPAQKEFHVEYKGKLIAILPEWPETTGAGLCVTVLYDLLEWVLKIGKCTVVITQNPDKFELKDEDGNTVAWLNNPTYATGDEWVNDLVVMSINFPVYRKDGAWYFRIPYPQMPSDTSLFDPCGCDELLPPDSRDCYIAWIGGCYESCGDAFASLESLSEKLKIENNYRAVFDCSCGSYRIEFIEDADIVAVNPQCYSTREMVCEAVERTKCLINCEGMHLVEHILLRPREFCNDCECLIPDCPETECPPFVWEEGEDDPCKADASDPCFIPGQDPYSCIATVVMPAWPKRFSTQASRDLVSRILYREAPSHILLRITWMSPKDFTRFEAQYKSWVRWLAHKTDYCNGPFDQCEFITLLFNTRLDCYWPETYCQPCDGSTTAISPCIELNTQEDRESMCDTTVNDVYCWSTPDCCYEYRSVSLSREMEAEKAKLIRRRATQYKSTLQSIADRWPEDKIIGVAVSYIKGGVANEEALLSLVKALKDEMNTEDSEKTRVYEVVTNTLVNFYLDRTLLDKYYSSALCDVRRTIKKLSLSKRNALPLVLMTWEEPDLKPFVHQKTIQALKGIFNFVEPQIELKKEQIQDLQILKNS